MLLLLLQAAVRALPVPTHVIVDKIPDAPGLSEWAKALISASIGAAFGIGSSILMEKLKSRFAAQDTRKRVFAELNEDVAHNLGVIKQAQAVLANVTDADDRPRALLALAMGLPIMRTDRFQYIADKEKTALYEADPKMSLGNFYRFITKILPEYIRENDFTGAVIMLEAAKRIGDAYLKMHKVPSNQTPIYDAETYTFLLNSAIARSQAEKK